MAASTALTNTAAANRFTESRRSARAIALQALYEWDAVRHLPTIAVKRIAEDFIDDTERDSVLPYAAMLIDDVWQDEATLDGLIQAHATAYPVAQIAAVDRNILRIALSEIKETRVPAAIAIDEAIELGRTFGTESSARFIHGVLGGVLAERTIAP